MNDYMVLRRLALTVVWAYGVSAAWAMPTRQQLVQAQPVVQTLTAEDINALRTKAKTAGDVAAAHLALVDKADTEAGKYLLLQGAFRLYARSGDYDSAAAVLQRMRGEIADLPPEVIVEIVNNEMRRVAASKAPRVLAIFRDAQRVIKCRKKLATIEPTAKSQPGNPLLQRQLAECHAGLGDWPKALEIFAKLGDAAAKWELGKAKDCDAVNAADFWWNYKAADVEPFKAHAAQLYRSAIDANQVSGLKREVVAKRLAEFEASGAPVVAAATGTQKVLAPTFGPWAIPANFKEPLVRTLKLANGVDMDFCAVPAGEFEMSNDEDESKGWHKVTITRPFWIGKQTFSFPGFKPTPEIDEAEQKVKKAFPEFDVLRTPSIKDVLLYCDALNEKYKSQLPKGYVFRLPTEAELEYAVTDGQGTLRNKAKGFAPNEFSTKAFLKAGLITNAANKQWWAVGRGDYKSLNLFPREPFGKWGMIGAGCLWGCNACAVLDKFDAAHSRVAANGKTKIPIIEYEKHETDPLRTGDTYMGKNDRFRNLKSLYEPAWCRIVIGPDLVAEKKGAKAVANPAPVPAPPVAHQAQTTTPTAKIKTHTIKLNSTVSMEFVECPAGTFTMGYEKDEYSPNRQHKVTITRPFWIARTKLTLEQYKAYDRKFKPCDESRVMDGDKSPFSSGHFIYPRTIQLRRQAEAYCEYLTKKFRNAIPKGYVFRLPSDAEWEYAYTAGETNPDDFYGMSGDATKRFPKEELEKYMITDEYIQAYAAKVGKKYGKYQDETGVAVGKCKPNRWGLYDMAGNTAEMVLDTLDRKLIDQKDGRGFGPKQTALVYEDEETDPLRCFSVDDSDDEGGGLVRSARGGNGGKWRRTGCPNTFRLVVGPDLVAEKKAAAKK